MREIKNRLPALIVRAFVRFERRSKLGRYPLDLTRSFHDVPPHVWLVNAQVAPPLGSIVTFAIPVNARRLIGCILPPSYVF